MAKIYPTELTSGFTGHTIASERSVYRKLADELSQDFVVFHDIRWDDPELDDTKTTGQIDFVVVHPELGFITLEVKGGRCSYDPVRRLWTTVDRDERSSTITDPFEQARAAARVLTKLLLKSDILKNDFLPHHHAAVFPDCVLEKPDLRGDIKSWQIIDRDSLFDCNECISSLFVEAFPNNQCQRRIGQNIISGLHELFGNQRLDGRQTLSDEIRRVNQRVVKLTDEQLGVFEMLREQKRMVVQGCAGSGKTTLAIHNAKTAARAGKRVLLACFNRPLGQFLARECEGEDNIVAGSLYDTVLRWLQQSGVNITPEDSTDWWTNVLPNAAANRIDAIDKRFDTIIVDEGQDFHANWWVLLEMLLNDQQSSSFLVFMDIHQNIYHGTADLPMVLSPVILNRNLRNTNQINAAIKEKCGSAIEMKPSGIDGPEVVWRTYIDDDDMLKTIESVLAQLIREGLRPADIVILGTKAQHRTVLKHGRRLGPSVLVEKRQKSNELLTMTMHRFKGLESPIVILCELNDAPSGNHEYLLYVGMSRATALLCVLSKK